MAPSHDPFIMPLLSWPHPNLTLKIGNKEHQKAWVLRGPNDCLKERFSHTHNKLEQVETTAELTAEW